MKKIYKKMCVLMMVAIVFYTMVFGETTTMAAADFNPKIGDYMTFGRIKEPIIWEIVNIQGKELTLMSYSSVGEIAFNPREVQLCANWNQSELKKYLNTYFYQNSFTADEKKIITKYNPKDDDKVYIPSLKELGLNNPKTMTKLDKTYKDNATLFQGSKFQKTSWNMYAQGAGWGASFATRNSDTRQTKVINVAQKGSSNPILNYTVGFMKMNIRPVIKITTDFKTENLQFTKGTRKINNKSVTLYTIDYRIKSVYVDGALIDLESEPPKIMNDTVLVPLSIISDYFKASIDVNTFTQAITISKDRNVLKLTINSNQAIADGKLQTLSTAVIQEGNTVYIPIQFVSEALGGITIYKDNDLNIKTHKF